MSDFDKFLGDKLDEEGQFPRRDKNWERLSQRLDTFDAIGQQPAGWRSPLRWWQVAAVGFLLVGAILFFRIHTVQRENSALREQVEDLQQKKEAPSVPVASAPGNDQAPVGNAESTFQKQAGAESLSSRNLGLSEAHPSSGARPSASAALREQKSRNLASQIHSASEDHSTTAQSNKSTDSAVVSDAPASKTSDPVANTHTDSATSSNPSVATQAANQPAATTPDSLQNIATTATPDTVKQNNSPQPESKIPEQKLADLPAAPQPDTLASPAPPKIIEPVKNRFRRIQVGIQAIVGIPQPRQQGVSLITGQGVTAEFAPLRRLWVTASADWLRFNVSTKQYEPRFHHSHQEPPKPPQPGQGGGPKHELVEVESSQQQQQYGLGLRYQLPFNGWIRPSVRVAHTWVRVSPSFISFKFEEMDNGGGPQKPYEEPEYFVRKEEAKQLNNIWRFGAGLEHETARWTFGLWADYSKNLAAADATFDALYVQGGVRYRL